MLDFIELVLVTVMISLHVALLPQLADRQHLAGSHVVVVDALRATTTITAALEAGATDVTPCRTIEDAQACARRLAPVLLAGERGGRAIEGFDLGNSPAEFVPERVTGKHVVMTTTNGTIALLECHGARRILVGAFANLTVVCEELRKAKAEKIAIMCAGADGRIAGEDVLFAGAVVERLAEGQAYQLDDAAKIAREYWQSVRKQHSGPQLDAVLAWALRTCAGGKNLLEIGMADDIEWAATIDRFCRVPEFDAASGRVVLPAA